MTAPDSLSLALWATSLSDPLNGVEAWAERVESRLVQARDAGARLLVMPEYAVEQWLSFKPAGLRTVDEIPWLADQSPAALAALKPLPARHGVALLAGTMPWRAGDVFRNRAWLLLPDGRVIAQDKLSLTPCESDPATWNMAPGTDLEIVAWDGLRIATLICLDVEMPALAALLAPHAPDLVLVPSATGRLSGYSRVFGCAKARAIELMTAVAAVGGIGHAPGTTINPTNVSGAAVYLPCEPELGLTGIHAALDPMEDAPDGGPLLIARDVPIGAVRALRQGGAEVWPGAWRADHIRIVEAGRA